MKTKVKTIKSGKHKFKPFENELDLSVMVDMTFDDRNFGAYLLNQGSLNQENNYQIVFGFHLTANHNVLFPQEVDAIVTKLNEGLKTINPHEKVTFISGCRDYLNDGDPRDEILDNLVDQCTLTLPKILLKNEQVRNKNLTKQGLRSFFHSHIFCTYTMSSLASEDNDKITQLVSKVTKFFDYTLGQSKQRQELVFSNLLRQSYVDGFLPWQMFLQSKCGLDISPMSVNDLWSYIWTRFNTGEVPPIPQVLKIEDHVLEEVITEPLHCASVLIRGNNIHGDSCCPQNQPASVYVNGNHTGVMVMNNIKGWSDRNQQISWVWDLISQQQFPNVELVVELSSANKYLIEDSLHRQGKQSKTAKERATEDTGRDAGAEIKSEEVFEAQKKIYRGDIPIHCAVVFLVHEKSMAELSKTCRLLSNTLTNAVVVRESNIAPKIWLETLPINWSGLLQTSSFLSERRLTLDNDTIPGVLPLVSPETICNDGVEFLSNPGGKPLYVDLFTPTTHVLITGMSGAGKSVLLWRFIIDALSRNIPVVGMDFPARDGESSFKTGIELLGNQGAYFDISRSCSNLMEPPDLRNFSSDPQNAEIRMKTWQNFIREALLTIIMSKVNEPHLQQRVDSILRQGLVKFLQDPTIIERYNQAFECGWKSQQWQNIPVLDDFVKFCTIARLNIKNPQPLDHQAINQIDMQIRALLSSPLGKAIGSPSSFSPEPSILFFALTGMTNEQDSFVMAINANAACIRLALSHPQSLFVGDELSVLCRKDGFSSMLGTLCATARKDGLSVLLSAQDPDTIATSSSAAMILQNITWRITGLITSNACKSYIKYLDYPEQIINKNAGKGFKANKQRLCSSWLVERSNQFWSTHFYPGEMSLASVANNQKERQARNRVLSRYSQNTRDQMYGLSDFSNQYIATIRSGGSFDEIN